MTVQVNVRVRDRVTYVEETFGQPVRELLDKLEAGKILTLPHVRFADDTQGDLVGLVTQAAQAYGYTLIFVKGDDESVDFLVKGTLG